MFWLQEQKPGPTHGLVLRKQDPTWLTMKSVWVLDSATWKTYWVHVYACPIPTGGAMEERELWCDYFLFLSGDHTCSLTIRKQEPKVNLQWVAFILFINRVQSVVMIVGWAALEQRLWLHGSRLECQEIMIICRHKSETLYEKVENYYQSTFTVRAYLSNREQTMGPLIFAKFPWGGLMAL